MVAHGSQTHEPTFTHPSHPRCHHPLHCAHARRLPPQLSQLRGLQALSVRRMLVSEGVLLTEHECLSALTALTRLELQNAEEEAWLLPPELLGLTRLAHLSIAGCDCS